MWFQSLWPFSRLPWTNLPSGPRAGEPRLSRWGRDPTPSAERLHHLVDQCLVVSDGSISPHVRGGSAFRGDHGARAYVAFRLPLLRMQHRWRKDSFERGVADRIHVDDDARPVPWSSVSLPIRCTSGAFGTCGEI